MSDENDEFIRALFGGGDPQPADPDAPPDFDAGVREPVPEPENPEQAHNAFMLNLVRASNLGGLGE